MFSAQNVIRDKTRELSKYETLPEPAQIEKLFPDGLSMNSEKYSPLGWHGMVGMATNIAILVISQPYLVGFLWCKNQSWSLDYCI